MCLLSINHCLFLFHAEGLDVDATKYGKKNKRVTVKRRVGNKSNYVQGKDDAKAPGRKRASYEIIVLSQDMIAKASNGQQDASKGLETIRDNSNVWNVIEDKCKCKIMAYPAWSFPDEIVGDVRNAARNTLKIFEADANLSK